VGRGRVKKGTKTVKQRKPSNPPQDQPNGNPRADTSMIVPPTTPSEDNATANGKDSREKPNPAKPLRFWQDHNKVVAIATVVIAVVNAVYAVFAYWQWQEIKESNRINGISAGAAKLAANTAHDTFVTTNRPYIGVYASKIQKQDCGSKDCDYLFRVTVKNFGPVPGDNFIFHYAVLSDGKPVTPLRGNFSPDVDQLWPGSARAIYLAE